MSKPDPGAQGNIEHAIRESRKWLFSRKKSNAAVKSNQDPGAPKPEKAEAPQNAAARLRSQSGDSNLPQAQAPRNVHHFRSRSPTPIKPEESESDSGSSSSNVKINKLSLDENRSRRGSLRDIVRPAKRPATEDHEDGIGRGSCSPQAQAQAQPHAAFSKPESHDVTHKATHSPPPSRVASPRHTLHQRGVNSRAHTHEQEKRKKNITSTAKNNNNPAAHITTAAAPTTPPSYDLAATDGREFQMLLQPETRPITQDQLVNEVKGIYAGLVMVEKKCVEICQQQSQTTNKLSDEQWQALIALHRTLLHEHHDFFLASQHPTASPALRRLAAKYSMPARMWRHGIHSFLELLRHRLPDSLEHMLAFVYLAYSMMALLMESVPSFVETWIECLGDLARYRMAIEEADLKDREIWAGVARMWYNKAADRSPNVGRIQHHLAVLARPNIVQQLFYYSKALISVIPFVNARESIMLLFSPLLEKSETDYPQKYALVDSSLVRAFGILFTRGSIVEYMIHIQQFTSDLDNHITRTGVKFKVQGPEIASILVAGILDFGADDNHLWRLFRDHMDTVKGLQESKMSDTEPVEDSRIQDELRRKFWKDIAEAGEKHPRAEPPAAKAPDAKFASTNEVASYVLPVWCHTTEIVVQRLGDKNTLPYVHMTLAFLWSLSFVPGALIWLEQYVPWSKLAGFLNALSRSGVVDARVESEEFPQPLSGTGRQLPEDFQLRGLVGSPYYFPGDFFQGHVVDEDERTLELPSHAAPRAERCLWLGARIVSLNRYMTYNVQTKQFAATGYALSLSIRHTPQSHTFTSTTTVDAVTANV